MVWRAFPFYVLSHIVSKYLLELPIGGKNQNFTLLLMLGTFELSNLQVQIVQLGAKNL
jgi:hypothetical protein